MKIDERRLKKEADICENIARMIRLVIMVSLCLILLGSCVRPPSTGVKSPLNYTSLSQEQKEEVKYKRNRTKAATVILITALGFLVINEEVKTDWNYISKHN